MKTQIRAITALFTFALAIAVANAAFSRVSWFPRAEVYRFPAWTPLNLGLVDEAIDRARQRANGTGYAIFLGDSIAHGDAYGRPSEALAARVGAAFPAANLTSPSMAFAVLTRLLDHASRTDARTIIVQINLKWVVHEWTPDKFADLLHDLSAAHGTPPWTDTLAQYALLSEARTKLKYRATNFTLRGAAENGLKPEWDSLWQSELDLERKPPYVVRLPSETDPALLKQYASYHGMDWSTADTCAALNDLIHAMAASKARVLAVVVPMNPLWDAALGTTKQSNENRERLEGKLHSLGIRVLDAPPLSADDFHDDEHLSVSGARKLSDRIVAALREPQP